MVRVSVVQNNYAFWVFNVVDELGNTLWTGTQQANSRDALAQSRYVVETHPEWGPASYFVDGETDANAAGKMPPPRIDPLKEAEAAGLTPVPGSAHLIPAGWREVELTPDGRTRPMPRGDVAHAAASEVSPDAGISERGSDDLGENPIHAQRQKVEQEQAV